MLNFKTFSVILLPFIFQSPDFQQLSLLELAAHCFLAWRLRWSVVQQTSRKTKYLHWQQTFSSCWNAPIKATKG